jgi:septation ring formation regulator EzrA
MGAENLDNVKDQLQLLRGVRKCETTRSDNEKVIKLAKTVSKRVESSRKPYNTNIRESLPKSVTHKTSLSDFQRLKLLKHIQKSGEKFEKIGKALDYIDRDTLLAEWGQIKKQMRKQVDEIRV